MKKMLKRTMSVITALAVLLSMGINSMAMELKFDLPQVSTWDNRTCDFTADCSHTASFDTSGGAAYYDYEADEKIGNGKGVLTLSRYEANSGDCYWYEYINSTYGVGDGYIELPITKSSADVSMEISTMDSSAKHGVMLRWDADGKLYSKYRNNPNESDASTWRYLADIEGLSATFKIYIYTDLKCYNVAVNDKYVACGLYSIRSAHTTARYIIINNVVGAEGDVYVDYKKAGSITDHVLIPTGNTIDASNVSNGIISVNTNFVGTSATTYPDWTLYAALYNVSGELEKVVTTSVTKENMIISGEYGYVSQDIAIGDLNYKELYVKSFLWTSDLTPIIDVNKLYMFAPPAQIGVINNTNALRHGTVEGTAYGDVVYDGTSMTITRNTDTPEGEKQYMASTNYNNGASYSTLVSAVMNFNLTKSRKDISGYFIGLPCDYVALNWHENGEFYACYRDSADEDGRKTSYKKLAYSTDALTCNVTVAFNGTDSTYSLWIDNVPVIVDKYSRGVYNGEINIPNLLSQVRIYTESGKAGDVFKLSDFNFYRAEGYNIG